MKASGSLCPKSSVLGAESICTDVLPMSAKFSPWLNLVLTIQVVKKRLREWIDAHEEEAGVTSVQQLGTELLDQSVPKGPLIV